MGAFKEPHGGKLNNLYLSTEQAEAGKSGSRETVSWNLNPRQLNDVELLLNGAFSPLAGFVDQHDYDRILREMRLSDGTLWPIPINLDVDEAFAESVTTGQSIALRDPEGVLIATLEISDIWAADKSEEASQVYGTIDETHPGVNRLMHHVHPVYLGGKLSGIEPPVHYDFKHLRHTPSEMRDYFEKVGWRRVVAFHTRNPLHRAHQELTLRAARKAEANLLIHPVIGSNPGMNIDHFTRVRCYEHILREYPEQTTVLSLLPLAMRMAGPREALWHTLIRKNYGCTHMIVGPHHASPGSENGNSRFYPPYAAQELVRQYEKEADISLIAFEEMVYDLDRAQFLPRDEIGAEHRTAEISSGEMRRRLQEGLEIEDWFSHAEVVKELRRSYPPRHQQGFTVFFTGLSGSGKSTIANALMVKLHEIGGRRVTLLDGDIVRHHLSSELGFSKEHRNINVARIGFVASEITKNGGIAICAPIAPYTKTRRAVRDMVSEMGGFIEVHVATPIEVCERRDRKGLYAKARAGIIPEFTGVSDPYELPENAEIVIDTAKLTPDLAAHRVLVKLESMGFLR